ncbi:MAG: O-antigen ligase family protein [Planctomycetes bacterium]|nr:O-antigen ligase family protein [Planctomycetota bacterium]
MLWLNIDADYRHLRSPSGLLEYLHAARALLAFAAAIGAYVLLQQRVRRSVFSGSSPVRLLAVYGVIALGASVLSESPFEALYWGGLYLAVFVVLEAEMAGGDPLARSAQLLTLTWLIVASLGAALAIVGWDVFFGEVGLMAPGAEVISVIPQFMGFTMSRSTGVGRLAAVPAVFALARVCHGRGVSRILWGVVLCAFVALLLATRARTPLFGLVAAALFMLSVQRGKGGLLLAVGVAVLAILADVISPEKVEGFIYRRGTGEDLLRMTGRTDVWAAGWEVFMRSPVVGLGPLADRFHMGWRHIHSTWLLALMQAGVVGAAFFVAAWAIGWRLFFRNLRRLETLPPRHQALLIESGAVLAFFTVRSIPETTAAAFSIDLLVIVPILAYLEILDRSLRQASAQQTAQRARNGCGFRRPFPMAPQAGVETQGSGSAARIAGKRLTNRRFGVE